MTTSVFSLPGDLSAPRSLLRSSALRQLLEQVWCEAPERPGRGCLRPAALQAIGPMAQLVATGTTPLRDALAWVLGLLAQASEGPGSDRARGRIREYLPGYLDALVDQVRSEGRYSGLLFLLGHFTEDASHVMARLGEALGTQSEAAQALSAIYDNAASRPERSRFILAYIGARACAHSIDARTGHHEQAMACPACRGKLHWMAEAIECPSCKARYAWHGDIPRLVPPGCDDPEQFPEALVNIYEEQTRPRFVQVMAGDWTQTVTPAREEAYLQRFLRPVPGPVLDLACGAGGWTRRVADCVGLADVIALDYSLPMLDACVRAVPGVTAVQGSASRLPFADASLGGMNCSDALQALPDPAATFAEASRCLRPGAPFTVFTFRKAAGPYGYFQHSFPASPRLLFQDEQIRQLAQSVGMDIIDMGGPGQALFFTAQKRS